MAQIGLGMAALGRPEYINIRMHPVADTSVDAFKQNSFDVLDTAYASGVRFFDTAPSYGKGESFLKEWHSLRNHHDAVLSTKWGYTYVAGWNLGYNGAHEIKEHSLNKLLEQWEFSKSLLPNLKVYQIHSATFESGVLKNEAVLEALFQLKHITGVKIGLTVSGVSQRAILETAFSIQKEGELLFDSYQLTFNIFEQSVAAIVTEIKTAGKFVIVKEGLANGRVFLSNPASELLGFLANKYNVGIDAIALRYCMDVIEPDIVLSGAFSKEQLLQNLKANEFSLTLDEVAGLSKYAMSEKKYWSQRTDLHWH
jgi:aryl-alcohol dehydrogenase-like predicted oxidoreductase